MITSSEDPIPSPADDADDDSATRANPGGDHEARGPQPRSRPVIAAPTPSNVRRPDAGTDAGVAPSRPKPAHPRKARNAVTVNSLSPPLAPRNGRTLQVLGVCRISTDHQDDRSLDDQEALIRRYVAACYDAPAEFNFIKTRDSGEALDRDELREIERLVRTRTIDVLAVEDLSRIARRLYAAMFCELCEDFATRVIAINDHVDTAKKDWRMLAGFSSMRHEAHNADIAARIKRSLDDRFARERPDSPSE